MYTHTHTHTHSHLHLTYIKQVSAWETVKNNSQLNHKWVCKHRSFLDLPKTMPLHYQIKGLLYLKLSVPYTSIKTRALLCSLHWLESESCDYADFKMLTTMSILHWQYSPDADQRLPLWAVKLTLRSCACSLQ